MNTSSQKSLISATSRDKDNPGTKSVLRTSLTGGGGDGREGAELEMSKKDSHLTFLNTALYLFQSMRTYVKKHDLSLILLERSKWSFHR